MPALQRLTAVSLSISLILAQGQGALAAISIVAPVQAPVSAAPAAAIAGVAGLRVIGTPGPALALSPALTGILPSVSIGMAPQTGAQVSLPHAAAIAARLSLSPALRPAVALPHAAAEQISPTQGARAAQAGPRASLAVLQHLADPKQSAPAASDTAANGVRVARMAAMFDGGMENNGLVFAADAPVAPGNMRSSRLSRLFSPIRRGPGEPGAAAGLKTPPSGAKPLSRWKIFKENRFLIAAAAGAALGLAGVNLGTLPVLSLVPGLFFGAMPWLAAPFIGLNVFKSFSHYSVIKESRTLLGFLVITVSGLVISAGVTIGMTALLPVVDPASFAAAALPGLATGGFSPMQFMLPIIALFTGAALLYKRARGVNDGSVKRDYRPGRKGALRRLYDRVVGLAVNGRTAPFLERAGKTGEKGTELINKLFPRFIDIVGIPAVAVLLSMTMATGGLGLLSSFGGYYLTSLAGMGIGMLALLAAYFAFGARAKDFKEILKAALVGFSISSSSATMPTEKEALKAMGVSRKTRDTVVPLGGVFNMFGTSLYMGLTAFYALSMFGAAPTLLQYLNTALAVLVIAMGAPGIPASNITLLDPVLRQTGLQSGQVDKVYTMILPGDRILDMVQTALNVLGDMLPAVEQDRKRLRYVRTKRIRDIRRKRAEAPR